MLEAKRTTLIAAN